MPVSPLANARWNPSVHSTEFARRAFRRGKSKSMTWLPLLFRSIKDGRRGIHDFEIGGHGEQGRIRIASHDIRQAERLFPHARVAPFAVDHRLEIGRSPHFGHNRNRLLISDLTGWYRVRRSCTLHQDAFHGLRTKVVGIASGGGNGGASLPSATLIVNVPPAAEPPATPPVPTERGGSSGIFCAVFSARFNV